MKNKSNMTLSNSDVHGLDFKTGEVGEEKKGFSYYLPVILLALLAITVIAEVKYRVLIDEFIMRYLFAGK